MRGSGFLAAMLTLCLSVAEARARVTRDLIESLPGTVLGPDQGKPLPEIAKMWSGFVEVDAHTDTNFFYVLVEAETQSPDTPLIWWMNGGPGASSLVGLFAENGPLLLNEENKLYPNEYAWNKFANVLYVEFGPGIGFSYCENSTRTDLPCKQSDGSCSSCLSSDNSVAKQNAVFLQQWLTHGFPEFAGRPLYIAGESYAGVYTPTLAKALLDAHNDTKLVNLQGIWPTDPCTDNKGQFGWLDISPAFALGVGMIAQPTYDTLVTPACTSARTHVGDRVRNTSSLACRAAWRQYDIATAGAGGHVHPRAVPGLPMYIDPLNALGPVSGPDLPGWIASARSQLHANASKNKVYNIALGNNGYDGYTSNYAACSDLTTEGVQPSMLDVYRDILQHKSGSGANLHTIVISNGDIDPVVAMRGTERAINALGVPVAQGGDRRPWFFHSKASSALTMTSKPVQWGQGLHALDAGVQVGGMVTTFAPARAQVSLSFVTIRDSGHMVPLYAPLKAQHVLLAMINRTTTTQTILSPPLPTGWDASTDEAFYAYGAKTSKDYGLFTQWVAQAMDVSAQG